MRVAQPFTRSVISPHQHAMVAEGLMQCGRRPTMP